MNKQALSTLSLDQLKSFKFTLEQRIQDLKFFNLDLGRENIRLAEQYRTQRDHAQKIKQGKQSKIRKANNYQKNIYLKKDNASTNQPIQSHSGSGSSNVNRNNFNFNDLYKVSKSKLTNWWGGKKKSQKPQEISPNVNEQAYHQQQYQQQYQHSNQHPNQQQNIVYVEFPEAKLIQENIDIQKDPYEQQIQQIITQKINIQCENLKENQQDQFGSYQQPHYQKLYNEKDHQKYIEQQKQINLQQIGQINSNSQSFQGVQKKIPNKKNFQFDDLPGMGWKKLKGLISWGGKNKQKKQSQNQQYNPNAQYQPQQYQIQHQIGQINQYQPQMNDKVQFFQSESPKIIAKQSKQIEVVDQIIRQRKRTPIFSQSSIYKGREMAQQQNMREQKIQKQKQPIFENVSQTNNKSQEINQDKIVQNQQQNVQQKQFETNNENKSEVLNIESKIKENVQQDLCERQQKDQQEILTEPIIDSEIKQGI